MENRIRYRNTNTLGFSLVELAIVLVIIGGILASAVSLLSLTNKQNKIQQTKDHLDIIEEAILDFYHVNGYIPCPATLADAKDTSGFGISDSCTSSNETDLEHGSVPNRTLNISDKYAIDGWGNKFTYIVVEPLAKDANEFQIQFDTDNPGLSDDGSIEVFYNTSSTSDSELILYETLSACTTNNCEVVAYVIVSHGETGAGAFTLSGAEISCPSSGASLDQDNCDDDDKFVDGIINKTSGATFYDDIIRWKTKSQIEADGELW